MYPGVGTFVLIRPTQTFYERIKLHSLHSWRVSVPEAKKLQSDLAPLVSQVSAIPAQPRHIAGLDIFGLDTNGVVLASAVVLGYPGLEIEEVRLYEGKPDFPYVPGYLSFRETPILRHVLEALELSPDLIIADGQGLAHPRKFGLACHIGLLTDIPTIGCAKSLLIGKHGPLGEQAGARTEVWHGEEVVAMVVRTRTNVRPVYVSVGHKVDLMTAVEWVLACCKGKRLPETTRIAHQAAAGGVPPGRWVSTPEVGLPVQGNPSGKLVHSVQGL